MTRSQHHGFVWQSPLLCFAAIFLVAVSPAASSGNRHLHPEDRPQSAVLRPGLLQPFNSVVGSWRGVGQPKRGSRRNAWQEKAVCRWDFSAGHPSIRFDSDANRLFARLTLTVSMDGKQLLLYQQASDISTRTFRGNLPAKWPDRIQLITEPDDNGAVYRCTIVQLNDIRLVMLFEQQAGPTSRFRRQAEIGYTRQGHKLAQSSKNQRECLVTGGQGTIPVRHKGKTWYVCCEGCRQAFEDMPDEIIADYLSHRKQAVSARNSSHDGSFLPGDPAKQE